MITIRPMTQKEYDEYQDFIESLEDKKIKETKLIRKMINYVCEKIYGIDLNAPESTPSICLAVFQQTVELTNKVDEEEIKNFVKSGNGVSAAE